MTDAKLLVNNKEIPLNEIMEKMLINLVSGYLKSLKKIPEDIKEINIKILF